ncbi:GNAT family N-acetyltransferase [Gordonia sp. HY442]|uniref:GNAT family N-acetyltransferase n=1 Tax=Gordonia zhenghanii TaxID=2911516 RepID=UPI001F010CAD|nr:GNAT family N-acetyltransferase [Gordonia zhenghanii]MCF8607241.1 GNAT family N-acetyltransferase [Gordonia zhenghanii]
MRADRLHAKALDIGVLDDPFTSALRGPQSRFARTVGNIVTFEPDVSVFYGHPREMTDQDYADLAQLAGIGHTASLRDRRTPLPEDLFDVVAEIDLVQYRGDAVEPPTADPTADPELVRLGVADVPEMTALIELTEPGPFLPRTIEMGVYLGYRDPDSGRLLAMAGQRLQLPGWTEISAVCTHPDARGRGLARRLVSAVAQVIVDEGNTPFLHTTADNSARRLYEKLGFTLNSEVPLEILRVTGNNR